MKSTLKFSTVFVMSLFFLIASCSTEYSVKINKDTYAPGEIIKIEYTADPNWNESAWIGIIPSSVAHGKEAENDANDIYYEYLKNSDKGTLEFLAPTEPGKYDIRMHDTDDAETGLEISSVTFTVE
ncbi:MAG: hypothetical protein ABFS35_07645 [Bacteroidota bacterium]